MRLLFSETMVKAETLNMARRSTAPIFEGSSMLSAREFMTLTYTPGTYSSSQWLDDSVIEHFARALLDISIHAKDQRIAFIDSLSRTLKTNAF